VTADEVSNGPSLGAILVQLSLVSFLGSRIPKTQRSLWLPTPQQCRPLRRRRIERRRRRIRGGMSLLSGLIAFTRANIIMPDARLTVTNVYHRIFGDGQHCLDLASVKEGRHGQPHDGIVAVAECPMDFERLLVSGCTELPACRCGNEMHVAQTCSIPDTTKTHIRGLCLSCVLSRIAAYRVGCGASGSEDATPSSNRRACAFGGPQTPAAPNECSVSD